MATPGPAPGDSTGQSTQTDSAAINPALEQSIGASHPRVDHNGHRHRDQTPCSPPHVGTPGDK